MDLKVHTPTVSTEGVPLGVRVSAHRNKKKNDEKRTCLHQSGERFPRPSPGVLGEECHNAPEILVQLAFVAEGRGVG